MAVPAGVASDQAFSGDAQLIEHWNGSIWKVTRIKGAPTDADLAAVTATSAHDVWAVGSYVWFETDGRPYAEHFDGRSWKTFLLRGPNPNAAYSDAWFGAVSASSPKDVWAVGRGHQRAMIEHYGGLRWRLVGGVKTDGSELLGVAAISPRDAWVVGWEPAREWDSKPLIEHWNGLRWRQVRSPFPVGNDDLRAISAISANDIWAVGDREIPAYHPELPRDRPLVLHWDGLRWRLVTCPLPARTGGTLSGVVAINANDVWAVGQFERKRHSPPLIEHWDGHSWRMVRVPRPWVSGELTAVSAASPTDVWAVGSRQGAKTLAEHWDGRSWTLLRTVPRASNSLFGIAAVSATDFWAVGGSGFPY